MALRIYRYLKKSLSLKNAGNCLHFANFVLIKMRKKIHVFKSIKSLNNIWEKNNDKKWVFFTGEFGKCLSSKSQQKWTSGNANCNFHPHFYLKSNPFLKCTSGNKWGRWDVSLNVSGLSVTQIGWWKDLLLWILLK